MASNGSGKPAAGPVGRNLGFGIAYWSVPALLSALPADFPLPRRGEIDVDGGVLWFTMAVSVACGLVFGVLPALQVDRARVAEGLKQGGRGGSAAGRGWRNALAVAEVGVAVLLVIGAGLMLRSFALLNSVDTGFRPDHLLTARMMLVFNKYARDLPRRAGVVEETLERIRTLPQVISASSITFCPCWEPTPAEGITAPIGPLRSRKRGPAAKSA